MSQESHAINAAASGELILAMFPKLYEKCFDFSPPAGWLGIVHRLSERLSCDDSIRCVQVKQKFGGLRFYVPPGTPDWASEAINIAEAEAAHTCERCGCGGATASGIGWHRTLCEECAS